MIQVTEKWLRKKTHQLTDKIRRRRLFKVTEAISWEADYVSLKIFLRKLLKEAGVEIKGDEDGTDSIK